MIGFRLHRFEVLNWGTFDQEIWHLDVSRRNALITGETGSGKSSLLDGLSTLLVSSKQLIYNKAAGAEFKERTRLSYVLGYYKSETNSANGSAKPVALRSTKQHSVLLAVFASETEQVTLAQVFWCKDLHSQPEQIFVVADSALSIQEHFTRFTDPTALRKRLKDLPGVVVRDSFSSYSDEFRRRLGIPSEQAMDLFAQTVSMKSVGNLTDFVREHMLDPPNVTERIDHLLNHYENLQVSHKKVVEARQQISQLEPLVTQCREYQAQEATVADWREDEQALPAWFAERKQGLLQTRLAELQHELAGVQDEITTTGLAITQGTLKHQQLAVAIDNEGGGRIAQLENDIGVQTLELHRRSTTADSYRSLASLVGLNLPESAEQFHDQRAVLQQKQADAQTEEDRLFNTLVDRDGELKRELAANLEIIAELESLSGRTSNIDASRIALRSRICQALNLSEERLPYVGELLRVREEAKEWEAAIERVLHGFASSLLVPADLHQEVSDWVNANHLGLRLTLYRFREATNRGFSSRAPDSLVRKMEIKDGPAHDWLHAELTQRFDLPCCSSPAECHRLGRGITREGYRVVNESRSEKDDHTRIGDRSRYILGWTNRDKIVELQRQRAAAEGRIHALTDVVEGLKKGRSQLGNGVRAIGTLLDIQQFSQIDAAAVASAISTMQSEITRLQESSDTLKELRRQYTEAGEHLDKLRTKDRQLASDNGRISGQISAAAPEMAAVTALVGGITSQMRDGIWPRLEVLAQELTAGVDLTLASLAIKETQFRRSLTGKITQLSQTLSGLSEKIITGMTSFCTNWPVETQEVDKKLAAGAAYADILRRLKEDDLPSFEEKFEKALHEHAIRGVVQFQATLRNQHEDISERIALINKSLTTIEFNRGNYIQLVETDDVEKDILDFKRDLKECTQNTLIGATREDNERAFQQVSQIIDRLRGRPDSPEADARWRARVTDVRNWLQFAASERRQDDHQQVEYYMDSSGKSGGQKERLAYTVLAASLAYQYRIHETERLRSFRFVIIDEAFGKGSDESARFGLDLFQKLDLQLLIATPLQKIHPIEPYVAWVGYIHIVDSKSSKIRNLTIEQLQVERAQHNAIRARVT